MVVFVRVVDGHQESRNNLKKKNQQRNANALVKLVEYPLYGNNSTAAPSPAGLAQSENHY